MTKNISKEDIWSILAKVKHPAINCTLRELGILKDVSIKDDKALITMALPFPNIPIIDQLVNSIKEPVENLGVVVEVVQTIMTPGEVQKFLKMEQDGWTW